MTDILIEKRAVREHKGSIGKTYGKMIENTYYQKRKWVGITGLCNNNCIFCLDSGRKRPGFKEYDDIEKEFVEGIKEGCERLVISGGEASIHPDFIRLISLGKSLGYSRIQTITNGRMFSNRKYLLSALNSGLDEITFSIHGHTEELHDSLTGVQGSFTQAIDGLKNALSTRMIVNVDIVLNRKNIDYFLEILRFLSGLGVREFDILYIVPFGNAWLNRECLMFSIDDKIGILHEGFDFARREGLVLWTNRFPAETLEGYEHLIQDPIKLVDEIYGQKDAFIRMLKKGERLECYGERCGYCCLNDFCTFLSEDQGCINASRTDSGSLVRSIQISKGDSKADSKADSRTDSIADSNVNLGSMQQQSYGRDQKIEISPIRPSSGYGTYDDQAPDIETIKAAILQYSPQDIIAIDDIPYCMAPEEYHGLIKNNMEHSSLDRKKDILSLASGFFMDIKTKSRSCSVCRYDDICDGYYLAYIRKHGYGVFDPITDEKITREHRDIKDSGHKVRG